MNEKRVPCVTAGSALLLALMGAGSAALGEGYWRFEDVGGATVLDSGPYGLTAP